MNIHAAAYLTATKLAREHVDAPDCQYAERKIERELVILLRQAHEAGYEECKTRVLSAFPAEAMEGRK